MRVKQATDASLEMPVSLLAASRPNGNGHLSIPGANGHSIRQEEGPERTEHPLRIVILGLSITSSWDNDHATTYRALVRELSARGHEVLFLERDQEPHASNRDLPTPPFGKVRRYSTINELKERHAEVVRKADFVLLGSYVQDGAVIGQWLTRTAQGATGFYDLDTPVTLSKLERGDLDYLSTSLIPRFDVYFSFTGGPTLRRIEKQYGSPMCRPLYCFVDTTLYYPEPKRDKWDFGYLGTYSDDRQPALDELLMQPARCWDKGRFVVAGSQFPRSIRWPANIKRLTHLSPARHRAFYNAQRFTLNITGADMVEAGYSPSVRLFEAAACGTPIISEFWEGLDSFFVPGEEILVANSFEEALYYLLEVPEKERQALGQKARARVLRRHTARHRAAELERYIAQTLGLPSSVAPVALPG